MAPHNPVTLDLGALEGSVLIFGGPYSNLPATRTMQAEAERRGIPAARTICNGDLVAYCAEPDAVVSTIREWGINVVMGNCEESLADHADDCGCGFTDGSACALLSASWYRFSLQHTDEAHRCWMAALPRTIKFRLAGYRCQVVHGTPSSINRFVFASTPAAEKRTELAATDCDLLIGGHSGIPFGQRIGEQYWLNSGAIGMPANEGLTGGWYLLLVPGAGQLRVEWHRLDYDWREAQRAMLRSGLANGYADALGNGLWPSLDVLPDTERGQRGQPLELSPLLLP